MRLILFALLGALLCCIGGCSIPISKPFSWTGFDAKKGVIADNAGPTVVVALTHATLFAENRSAFDESANLVLDSMPRQPGLVGYSVRKQLFGDEVWTATVWTNEESLQRFAQSVEHMRAVSAGGAAVKTIRYRRFEMASSELPLNWSRALAVLDEGKTPLSAR